MLKLLESPQLRRAYKALLLAPLLVCTLSGQCHSLSPFTSFRFAPNGVCVQPQLFRDVQNSDRTFTMRNVPGEGDCMFLAVALATFTSVGLGANDVLLRAISRETRQVVASILETSGNLVIEGKRLVPARSLLLSASKQEGLSPEDYLISLRKEGTEGGLYGGGPELTVLANVLRRPISIYELAMEDMGKELDTEQIIECKGTFGQETFQDPLHGIPDSAVLTTTQPAGAYSWHLHILVVNVSPSEKHACVLLPRW